MLGRPTDLPLRRDATARFLPWIIAIMVYLAALTLTGAMVVGSAVSTWSSGLSGTVTVQIPPAEDGESATRAQVATAVRLLRETPGIERIEVLDADQIGALLEPWLGPDVALANLPLPRLIDVTLADGAEIDTAALGLRLTALVPEAVVDDHRKWLSGLLRLARAIELLSALVVALIGLAAVSAVVFAARAGLAIHHTVIEVMHLIGARDNFIAGQFQRQALWLGLAGGVLGVGAAAVTLLLLGRVASRVEAIGTLHVVLSPTQWAVLAALPLATAIVTMVTARIAVLRTLARMP